MRHLTNYYKNLAEQLQSEVYRLTKILQESHPSTRADRRRAESKAKKHPHKDFKGDGGKRREFEKLSGKPVRKSERRDDDLTESKDSDKQKGDAKFKESRKKRSEATQCQICGLDLDLKGGVYNSGLCRVCATDQFR